MQRRSISTLFVWLALVLAAIPLALAVANEPQPAWHAKVDSWVLQQLAESGQTEALLYLSAQADLSGAALQPDRVARGQFVFYHPFIPGRGDARAVAGRTGKTEHPLSQLLDRQYDLGAAR